MEDARLRVDYLSICICISRRDKADIVFEERVVEGNTEDVLETVRDAIKDYAIRPSFQYIVNEAIESSPEGPDGVRHTMSQIQDWYHHRWVPPFAVTCKVCGHVKAYHGPSNPCTFNPEE